MDIFEQLKIIDSMDTSAIKDDEFAKNFSPFMSMKWYAATTDPRRVLLVNELVNPMLFSLHSEKTLLYYLLCCCSDGQPKRYKWVKRPKKINKHILEMLSYYYDISSTEATGVFKSLTKDDLLEILSECGYDTDTMKKIKKAL